MDSHGYWKPMAIVNWLEACPIDPGWLSIPNHHHCCHHCWLTDLGVTKSLYIYPANILVIVKPMCSTPQFLGLAYPIQLLPINYVYQLLSNYNHDQVVISTIEIGFTWFYCMVINWKKQHINSSRFTRCYIILLLGLLNYCYSSHPPCILNTRQKSWWM